MNNNPYVGPRPLNTGDPFFGRDREIYQIRDLLSSERILLVYSPSGAGKTSLVSAGLIPRLKSRFDIWVPTRLNLQPPPGISVSNRYAWSAAAVFEQEVPQGLRRPAESFTECTIEEYVRGRPKRPGAPKNIALVFDQFEEVLRIDPYGTAEKRAFFRQLGDLLTDSRIWALFLLREDYLAPLDPYCRELPTNLRNRYRIDLLSLDQASEAIAAPAAGAGRPFTPAAVQKLVDDLASVKVQQPDGSFVSQTGLYVEPLQLQVVCRGLWERVLAESTCIDQIQVEQFGNTSQALSSYYAEQIRLVSGSDTALERSIRDWFEQKLITADGIRNLVMRGPASSEGLANEHIDRLVDAHLVRAEQRAGTFWYELVHDRLVEPVRADNSLWRDAHLHPVQRIAALWDSQNRPEGLLLIGVDLREAETWERLNSLTITPVEQAFLQEAAAKQRAIEKEKRQHRLLRLWAAIATISAVVALAFFAYAYYEYRLARSRELAASSLSLPEASEGASMLQALEAVRTWHTQQAWQALETASARVSGPRFVGHEDDVTSMAFHPGGRVLATSSKDGTARLWDVSAGNELKQLLNTGGIPLLAVTFDSEGSRMAIASGDGSITVIRTEDVLAAPVTLQCPAPALDLSFDRGSLRLAGSCGDNTARVWDLQTTKQLAVLKGHSELINQVRFDRSGSRLVTAGKDGRVFIWNIATRTSERSFTQARPVTAASFTGNGEVLETASIDGYVTVYKGVTSRRTIAHASGVWSLDALPVGARATGGVGGDVMLWRNGAVDPFLTIPAPSGKERAATVKLQPSEGRYVAVARGKSIWLYRTDLDKLIEDSRQLMQKRVKSMDMARCEAYFGTSTCPQF